ncbi:hypothetical protein C1H57_08190 [Clostridium sp. 2-1]|uniref:hypothetical protein n=1 Tax=Clostridium TaxID=1485 RepID=UPI0003FA0C15|nr:MULTISPECIES: hypothetical protein [Clostridium]MBN7575386.1 hypothetical protein [Clostridium beijerinckii]MBN7580697.1 hypothetical protein [Clostridium beijerinckii]MBN7585150.1 hypothetical protein [Clostridium beijerinckii]MBO0522520.1 hypothetical protein [Clostridium beijerinckii]POO91792.1 hypothetical protein C1H57_08190 [Clostridium sp. 2-1]
MKKKTNAEIGMEKTRNAIAVHNRLANAILEEKKKMEREGMEVPLFSISVKGDTRHPWTPEKYFNKNFKSYIQQIKKTYGLSVAEMGIISILSYHITYENNLITNEDGTPMIKKDLETVLGIRQNAVDKYMASLVKKGVFASVKVKRSVNYYLDPRIAYQGNRIDSTLLSMFHIRAS